MICGYDIQTYQPSSVAKVNEICHKAFRISSARSHGLKVTAHNGFPPIMF